MFAFELARCTRRRNPSPVIRTRVNDHRAGRQTPQRTNRTVAIRVFGWRNRNDRPFNRRHRRSLKKKRNRLFDVRQLGTTYREVPFPASGNTTGETFTGWVGFFTAIPRISTVHARARKTTKEPRRNTRASIIRPYPGTFPRRQNRL